MTRHLEAALDYARAGYEVFPLIERAKAPLTAHGLLDATTDYDQIEWWWRRWPNANVGMRLPENTIALDIDPRSGGTLDQLGQVPPTWEQRTGGGGWHLLFRFRGSPRGKLADAQGVDIKGRAGYLVVEPSIHPSGTRYEWTNNTPIARLPEPLRARVEQPRRPVVVSSSTRVTSASGAGLVRSVAEAVEGSRNQLLFWAGCCAYERGGDPLLLNDIRDAARSIGLSDIEIERTLRSAQNRTGVSA